MALLEKTLIDRIEVVENGILQVRQATIIERDGVELTRSFHRWALEPGQNIDDQPARVKAIAAAVWTDDVVLAFMEAKEKATPPSTPPAT